MWKKYGSRLWNRDKYVILPQIARTVNRLDFTVTGSSAVKSDQALFRLYASAASRSFFAISGISVRLSIR